MPWWVSLFAVLLKEVPTIIKWVREHQKPNEEAVKEVAPIIHEAFKHEGVGSPSDIVRE